MTSPSARYWTIGELSGATGLSVRVLRYWEQCGLLASSRTASGHRRFEAAQITRLYQAMALRRTGLGLKAIAALLDQDDQDPSVTLQAHLDEIEADLRHRTRLRDRLAAALAGAAPAKTDPQLLMKVIQTMTMFEQYVHGYHDTEHRRLHDQAGTLADLLHDGIAFSRGSTVLEAGCGVGAQTITLARRNPGAVITSIDISTNSLAQAERRAVAADINNVRFVVADVYHLDDGGPSLIPGSFDHVFVCFLLEHLTDPIGALHQLRSMLKPGGKLTVIEGDHGSTYFHPDSELARAAVACQVTLQQQAGGDAQIGRRLYPLLTRAGYDQVHVEPRPVYVDASRPEMVDGFIRKTFIAMIAGIREPAIAAGLIEPEQFDVGLRDLEATTSADGVFCYTFFRATATTPA